MALTKLLSGLIDVPVSPAPDVAIGDNSSYIRPAILVYEGEFESMSGPVTVTKEDLIRVATNHNAYLEHCSMIGNGLQMKDYPPLQLDHSTSARDTVGRLTGKVRLGPYIRKDGKEVLGLYGDVCFLGIENCERAQDGRWTHLSVGVDFEKGLFSELTVTPFPAAGEASLLSSVGSKTIKGFKVEVKKHFSGKFELWVDGGPEKTRFETADEAWAAAAEAVDKYIQDSKGLSKLARWSKVSEDLSEIEFGGGLCVVRRIGGEWQWNCDYRKEGRTISPSGSAATREQAIKEAEQACKREGAKLSGVVKMSRTVKTKEYKGKKIEVKEDPNHANPGDAEQEYIGYVNGKMICSYGDIQSCIEFCEEKIDQNKLSQGEGMDEALKKRLMKHFTAVKKMSEEDAEKELSRLSSEEAKEELSKLSAEADEEEKKLAAEEDEKLKKLQAEEEEKAKLAKKKLEEEEKAKEDKLKKLSAARDGITRLKADFRKNFEGAQLAAKKGSIITRLAKLRSEAKITPAEVKKMDIDKLSASPQDTIDAVMKSYENREPVIMVGQFGSVKAEELANLGAKTRMSKLEEETRANMTMLRNNKPATTQLGAKKMEDVNVHIDTTPHTHVDMEGDYKDICKMMDEGKSDEAKAKLKSVLSRMSYGSSSALSAEDTEKQLSSLAENVNKMQNQFEELTRLTSDIVGSD